MINTNQPSNIPQGFARAVSIEITNTIVALASGSNQVAIQKLQDLQRKADFYTRKSYDKQASENDEFQPTEPGSNG